jgi:hypothetical protein
MEAASTRSFHVQRFFCISTAHWAWVTNDSGFAMATGFQLPPLSVHIRGAALWYAERGKNVLICLVLATIQYLWYRQAIDDARFAATPAHVAEPCVCRKLFFDGSRHPPAGKPSSTGKPAGILAFPRPYTYIAVHELVKVRVFIVRSLCSHILPLSYTSLSPC